MNPYPLSALNHFTVPVAMKKHLLHCSGTGRGGAVRASGTRSVMAPGYQRYGGLSLRYGPRMARRRLASARVASERATPESAAALALVTSSSPDASEKLIATSLPTPSASRMPAVVPTLATAPPAVIGTTPAAALRQRTQSAVVGENANPSALRSSALPTARVVQQAKR